MRRRVGRGLSVAGSGPGRVPNAHLKHGTNETASLKKMVAASTTTELSLIVDLSPHSTTRALSAMKIRYCSAPVPSPTARKNVGDLDVGHHRRRVGRRHVEAHFVQVDPRRRAFDVEDLDAAVRDDAVTLGEGVPRGGGLEVVGGGGREVLRDHDAERAVAEKFVVVDLSRNGWVGW